MKPKESIGKKKQRIVRSSSFDWKSIPKGKENTHKNCGIFSIFTAAIKLSKSVDENHQIVVIYTGQGTKNVQKGIYK